MYKSKLIQILLSSILLCSFNAFAQNAEKVKHEEAKVQANHKHEEMEIHPDHKMEDPTETKKH